MDSSEVKKVAEASANEAISRNLSALAVGSFAVTGALLVYGHFTKKHLDEKNNSTPEKLF